MKDGPDISKIAAMIGDPARANMLMALMSGMSLTSNELAREAGITASTASGHLSQLEASGLVISRKQGRYRYVSLAGADVAHAVEALVTVAARAGHLRTRPGPRDDIMREARTCYDHLAGRVAVQLLSIGWRPVSSNGEARKLCWQVRRPISSTQSVSILSNWRASGVHCAVHASTGVNAAIISAAALARPFCRP